MKINIEYEVEDKRLADLLCCAIEGGIGYWARIAKVSKGENDVKPWGDDYAPDYIQAPFCTNGYVVFEDEDESFTLDRESMKRGLGIMASKYPWHFNDFIAENEDSETGDVFVQCCLLGDIFYG